MSSNYKGLSGGNRTRRTKPGTCADTNFLVDSLNLTDERRAFIIDKKGFWNIEESEKICVPYFERNYTFIKRKTVTPTK